MTVKGWRVDLYRKKPRAGEAVMPVASRCGRCTRSIGLRRTRTTRYPPTRRCRCSRRCPVQRHRSVLTQGGWIGKRWIHADVEVHLALRPSGGLDGVAASVVSKQRYAIVDGRWSGQLATQSGVPGHCRGSRWHDSKWRKRSEKRPVENETASVGLAKGVGGCGAVVERLGAGGGCTAGRVGASAVAAEAAGEAGYGDAGDSDDGQDERTGARRGEGQGGTERSLRGAVGEDDGVSERKSNGQRHLVSIHDDRLVPIPSTRTRWWTNQWSPSPGAQPFSAAHGARPDARYRRPPTQRLGASIARAP